MGQEEEDAEYLDMVWKKATYSRLNELLRLFPHHVKEWFKENKDKIKEG